MVCKPCATTERSAEDLWHRDPTEPGIAAVVRDEAKQAGNGFMLPVTSASSQRLFRYGAW
jgi:hypothetical protein